MSISKTIFPESSRAENVDIADIPSEKASVTRLDVLFMSLAILTHIIDMLFDYNIAVQYYLYNRTNYFVWTLFIILFPSFVNTLVSIRMYQQDKKEEDSDPDLCRDSTKYPAKSKGCFLIVTILQFAPVLRSWDCLMYALKARRCQRNASENERLLQKKCYYKMLKEDQDVALLRVFECFIEAAPQVILQLTIILRDKQENIDYHYIHQLLSIVTSLISMSWAMASYHRTIRLVQWDKTNIDFVGMVLQLTWHFFITVSRILSISLVASIWALYTVIACSIHWLVMTLWITSETKGVLEFCRNPERPPHTTATVSEKIKSFLFSMVLGVVYVFVYLNPKDGSTFNRHLVYYILILVENTGAIFLWSYMSTPHFYGTLFYIIIALSTIPFLIGSISMILYYAYFHPIPAAKITQPPLIF